MKRRIVFYAISILFYISCWAVSPTLALTPDIQANGSDSAITVSSSFSLSLGLDSGNEFGQPADWWLVRVDESGNFFSFQFPVGWIPGLSSVYQGPVIDFPMVTFSMETLPDGNYTYYFVIDTTPDAQFNFPFSFDLVDVTVRNQSASSAGDYGDAPDGGMTGYPAPFAQVGNFPTLKSSNGARTLSVSDAVLGQNASMEMDADDLNDPDGEPNLNPDNTDSDDGISSLFMQLISIPPPTVLTVTVTGPVGGAGGTFYLNTLIDLNMDGEWEGETDSGEAEWVVQNFPVRIEAGESMEVSPPAFAFANGLRLPDGAWMRIALTKERIESPNWDGSGEFSSGEIEDHIIVLPELDGKKHPLLVVDCGGPYDMTGRAQVNANCNVTNLRPVTGTFDWTVSRVSGTGVDVNPKSGNNVAIGPAPGPGNSVNVGLVGTRQAGTMPSTWRFVAIPDPESEIFDGGVIIGHGEIGDNVMFVEEQLPEVYIGGMEGWFQHFDGFSKVMAQVSLIDDEGVGIPNASMDLKLNLPNESYRPQGLTVTTDKYGNAEAAFTIYSYGSYQLSVEKVDVEGYIYNPEMNTMTNITVDVN